MRTAHVFITDSAGYALARYALLSLALAPGQPRDIHLFHHGFDPGRDEALLGALEGLPVRYAAAPIGDSGVEQHRVYGHVTTASLLRLAAIRLLAPDYDRVVCLDTDTLTFGDPGFEDMELGGHPVGAVVDMDLAPTGVFREWCASHAAARPDQYFNSGVMVFDTRHWDAEAQEAAYQAELERHERGCTLKIDCTSPEQCALNHMFRGNWMTLPLGLNMQASARTHHAWGDAVIRHYCGPAKFVPLRPWRADGRDWALVNGIAERLGESQPNRPWWQPALACANRLRQAPYTAKVSEFLAEVSPEEVR